MAAFMKPFVPQTYALMRIMSGLLFLCHGAQKLLGWPQAAGQEMPAFVKYGAGGIELVGGLLVALGLFTRWAAFICSGQMAAAYWMAHGMQSLFPLVNKGELAVLYCFVFLFVSAYGPGIWSADGARSRA